MSSNSDDDAAGAAAAATATVPSDASFASMSWASAAAAAAVTDDAGGATCWSVRSTVALPNASSSSATAHTRAPVFALGTSYQQVPSSDRRAHDCRDAVLTAVLDGGVRAIDTAARYNTERDVGAALVELERRHGVARDALHVQSKLWLADMGSDAAVVDAYRRSCAALGVRRLDSFLVHWPADNFGGHTREHNARVRALTWRALERLYLAGEVGCIGVSNWLETHLDELFDGGARRDDATSASASAASTSTSTASSVCTVLPAINQIEFNAFQHNTSLVEHCRRRGVVVQGYCPLAKGAVLDASPVRSIAAHHRRSSAQVLLRFAVQRGVPVVCKASRREHLLDSVAAYSPSSSSSSSSSPSSSSWQLDDDDMRRLSALDRNLRVTWDPTGVP